MDLLSVRHMEETSAMVGNCTVLMVILFGCGQCAYHHQVHRTQVAIYYVQKRIAMAQPLHHQYGRQQHELYVAKYPCCSFATTEDIAAKTVSES
jgi:hypothetical protein